MFATRSPHRPNPIGLSLCRLLEVRGRTIRVADPDLLDGTPILDIKPYIPGVEAFPDSAAGWLDVIDEPTFEVVISPSAAERLTWIKDQGVDLASRAVPVLERHPEAHPSRRTKALGGGEFLLGVKSWRVRYRVDAHTVTIYDIASGYDASALAGAADGTLHDDSVHRAFHARWPQSDTHTTGDL